MVIHEILSAVRVFALAGATLIAAQTATAASWNFAAIGDGAEIDVRLADGSVVRKTGGEGNWNYADRAGNAPIVGGGAGILDGGVTLYMTGASTSGLADAFIDAKDAGLGVCSSLPIGCKSGVPGAASSDDNLNRAEESLTARFNQIVRITGLSIRDANHNLANGAFSLAGTSRSVIDGAVDPAVLALIAPSDEFTLKHIPGGTELYISSLTVAPVPLPAAMWLMLGALGGFGLLAKGKAT